MSLGLKRVRLGKFFLVSKVVLCEFITERQSDGHWYGLKVDETTNTPTNIPNTPESMVALKFESPTDSQPTGGGVICSLCHVFHGGSPFQPVDGHRRVAK